jgi:uncharacterized protein YeaO (DUF488 family)
VRIKRIYDEPERSDGLRVLVDRVWPRGVKKGEAALNDWLRELAPSTGLRKWFGHDPGLWSEFRRRYRVELREHVLQLNALRRLAALRRITLVYSAKDPRMNQAVVLQAVIQARGRAHRRRSRKERSYRPNSHVRRCARGSRVGFRLD